MISCKLGRWLVLGLIPLAFLCANVDVSYPQQDGADAQVEDASGTAGTVDGLDEQQGMTLYDLLAAGGWVMMVIILLSALALAMAIYFGVTLTEKNLVPSEQVTQIRHFIRDGRYDDIVRLCRRSKGMFAKVVLAGLIRSSIDPSGVAAAMEAVGRRETESLMRRIRFLSDVATVAPMLGLLGTVLGMINAFNFIAFDISTVKPVALAGAVAQALVTTAAGLIVAIPSMGFFFYFRARLQAMVGKIEEVAVEIAEHITMKAAER